MAYLYQKNPDYVKVDYRMDGSILIPSTTHKHDNINLNLMLQSSLAFFAWNLFTLYPHLPFSVGTMLVMDINQDGQGTLSK